MIKLIIFDWDDVFTLDSREGYIKCLHDTLLKLNIHLDPKEEEKRIHQTWSKPHRDELQNLLKERPELLDKACKIYEDLFFNGTFIDSLRLVKGSSELLIRLSNKYKLAIATGAHPKILKDKVFNKFKIPQVFSQIVSAYEIEDESKQKPNTYMLEKIMKDQSVNLDETVYVGDAKNDVLMAQNANVPMVVVLTGHLNKSEAEDLKVPYIIEDVTKLESVLSKLDMK